MCYDGTKTNEIPGSSFGTVTVCNGGRGTCQRMCVLVLAASVGVLVAFG